MEMNTIVEIEGPAHKLYTIVRTYTLEVYANLEANELEANQLKKIFIYMHRRFFENITSNSYR